MLSVLVLAIFLSNISHSIALIEYIGTVVNESMTLYDNNLFSLETSELDDNVLYLIITRPIINADKLRLHITVERFDDVQFPIPEDPVLLCDLLEEEATNQDNILSTLRFSRVFNMEGMRCPILAGKRKLMPYIFPRNIILHNDTGCGQFDFKTVIEICDEEKQLNCTPLISADTLINLQTQNCSNILI